MEIDEFLNVKEFLVNNELLSFNFEMGKLETIKTLLENEKKENVAFYLKNVSLYNETSEYLNLTLKDIENTLIDKTSISDFIKKANTNFTRILKFPENKKEREIINKIKDDYNQIDKFYFISEKFREHKTLMKNEGIQFFDFFDKFLNGKNKDELKLNFSESIENLNDTIEKNKIKSNGRKLMRSVLSNKYRHLVNDKTILLFEECVRQDITKQTVLSSIAPKIAAMKTPEDFNSFIIDTLGLDNIWSKETFKEKIKQANAEILFEENNSIYVDISTFEQSSQLGSKMWCLTREEEYLENYLYEDHSRLVFKFDFNKDILHKNSYTAILYTDNNISEVYDKNDDYLHNTDVIFKKLDTVTLPRSSDKTIDNKSHKYDELLGRDSLNDFQISRQSIKNLISLGKIKELESNVNDIGYYFNSFFKEKIIDFVSSVERKEGIDYLIEKNSHIFTNSYVKDPLYPVLLGVVDNSVISCDRFKEILNTNKVQKMIDNLGEVISNNSKAYNSLDESESIFNINNTDKLKTLLVSFNEKGVKPSHFMACQTIRKISNEALNVFLEIEPKCFENAIRLNNKRTIISLTENIFNHKIQKSIRKAFLSDKDNLTLLEKRKNVLLRKGRDDLVKNIDKLVKEENKQKLKMK